MFNITILVGKDVVRLATAKKEFADAADHAVELAIALKGKVQSVYVPKVRTAKEKDNAKA